jgi:TPP-dependent 2-oxoacid decarboxylase
MRAILAWLNKRFPEVLTVTRQDYTELREEVAQLNAALQGIHQLNERLQIVETNIKQLNNSQGIIAQGKGSFRLER